MLIFGGVKFLPCIIILHFLRSDLEQEVTQFMMHNHHDMNVNYTRKILSNMLSVIAILLIISGIELNQGAVDNRTFSDSNASCESNIYKYTKRKFSFVHLNVRSLKLKLDLISAEYGDFDISFTETWLNHTTPDRDIKLSSFNVPLRIERVGSLYEWVAVYIKEVVHYERKTYLEINGLECVSVELKMKKTKTLCMVLCMFLLGLECSMN